MRFCPPDRTRYAFLAGNESRGVLLRIRGNWTCPMNQHSPSLRMDECEAESLRALLRDDDVPVTFGPAAAQRIGEAISRVMLKDAGLWS